MSVDTTKLYGITHVAGTGAPVLRATRSVKVGIGLPKGKDIHAYIDASGKWVIRVGKDLKRFEKMEDARSFYRQAKDGAPEVNYPRKLPYMVFTRPGPDNTFDPDWETTQAHGSMPREIDIMFTDNHPMEAQYALWTASELKCHGDGINAMRVPSMANPAQQDLAAAATAAGEKYFPVMDGCFARGCPYSKPEFKNGKEYPAQCKPHAKLQFQLLAQPRLGSVAQFDTTSIRSISQLFSCLQIFLSLTGQGDPSRGFVAGIPLKMVLQPFKVNHRGQPSTAYAVGLEFRVTDATQLKTQLLSRAFEWNRSVSAPAVETRQITAAAIEDDSEDFEPHSAATETAEAQAFTAEFMDDGEAHEGYGEATQEEQGSVDAAKEAAIKRLVELSGFTAEQVEKHIESPDTIKLCREEFGDPPNAPRGERPAQESVRSTQQTSDKQAEQKPGPVAVPNPVPTTKPATKLVFGKRPEKV